MLFKNLVFHLLPAEFGIGLPPFSKASWRSVLCSPAAVRNVESWLGSVTSGVSFVLRSSQHMIALGAAETAAGIDRPAGLPKSALNTGRQQGFPVGSQQMRTCARAWPDESRAGAHAPTFHTAGLLSTEAGSASPRGNLPSGTVVADSGDTSASSHRWPIDTERSPHSALTHG